MSTTKAEEALREARIKGPEILGTTEQPAVDREAACAEPQPGSGLEKRRFADVFNLDRRHGLNSRAKNPQPIMISVLDVDPALRDMIPLRDPAYVFHPEKTKNVMIALELGMTLYLTGHTGTGKTSLITECCAVTNRPLIRVQHTENTEEAQILGQYTLKDGETAFQLGPLPFAMLHGVVFLADEYDFALPSVTAVYQPVMEGRPLVIKDAPPNLRIIRPHPHFRFVGTGNTNGQGDSSGLYQGTRIMNAANYSRWALTEEINYHEPDIETRIVRQQSEVSESTATLFVDLAIAVRDAFNAGKLGSTIGPREMINAAKIGKIRGGDYRSGLKLAFSNRLAPSDKLAVDQMAQRLFGP